MGMTAHPPAGAAPRFSAGLLARACLLSLSACGPTEESTHPTSADAATPSGPSNGGTRDSGTPDLSPPDLSPPRPPDLSRPPDLVAHPVDLSQPPTPPGQRTLTFVNKCSEPVWVGALGNPGNALPLGGGWKLDAGASQNVTIPSGWAGR